MDDSPSDLPTCVERLRQPVSLTIGVRPAVPLLEVALVAQCRNVDELVKLLHPFVDGDQIILPAHPLLTIGEERTLRLSLADGSVVLRGSCGAIESVPTGAARPRHMRVQLLALDDDCRELFQRLHFVKRFHGGRATIDAGALIRLSRLVWAGEQVVTPVPVEGTAILESADLEPLTLGLSPRRIPPPLPHPGPIARRVQILDRMAPSLAPPEAVALDPPPGQRRGLPAPKAVVLAVLVGIAGGLWLPPAVKLWTRLRTGLGAESRADVPSHPQNFSHHDR